MVSVLATRALIPTDLSVQSMCCLSSFIAYCLCDTLQAVAVLNIGLEMVICVFGNSVLLHLDEMFQFPELCTHVVKLVNLFVDVEMRCFRTLAKWLKSFGIWIGHNLIRNR